MNLDSLSNLELIYSFIKALGSECEWAEKKTAIKISGGCDFFSRRNLVITSFDTLAVYLNTVKIIENYAVEIKIEYDSESNIKSYKCSRINSNLVFESKILLEAILKVVVEWRFRDENIDKKNIQEKMLEEKHIPLESLNLSFALNLNLRKNKIAHLSDLDNLNASEIYEILGKNDKLYNELKTKLRDVGVFI